MNFGPKQLESLTVPLVRSIFPDLIAQKLTDIQPMYQIDTPKPLIRFEYEPCGFLKRKVRLIKTVEQKVFVINMPGVNSATRSEVGIFNSRAEAEAWAALL